MCLLFIRSFTTSEENFRKGLIISELMCPKCFYNVPFHLNSAIIISTVIITQIIDIGTYLPNLSSLKLKKEIELKCNSDFGSDYCKLKHSSKKKGKKLVTIMTSRLSVIKSMRKIFVKCCNDSVMPH